MGWHLRSLFEQRRGNCRKKANQSPHAHLRFLNPFPKNLGDIISRYKQVLVPELNMGQLRLLLRDRYLVDAKGLNKIKGKPFLVSEVVEAIEELL